MKEEGVKNNKGIAVSTDGIPIHYEAHGQGTPALIFVHGAVCKRSQWRNQINHFSPHYTVVTIDLAGHGESGTGRKFWSMEAFGEDVSTVVTQLGLEQAVLVGHSMGGSVILEAALRIPDRVLGLVCVDTMQELDRDNTREELEEMFAPLRTNFAGVVQDMARDLLGPETDPMVVQEVLDDIASMRQDVGIGEMLDLWSGDRRRREVLEQLECPIVVIAGDYRPFDVDAAERYGIELKFVSGVGHWIMMEEPETFNQHLEDAVHEFKKKQDGQTVAAPDVPLALRLVVPEVAYFLGMLAGVELDLFSALKMGPMAGEQVANAIGVGPQKLKMLLYALVNAGLLTVEGDRFSNTPEANHFLVRGGPFYVAHGAQSYSDRFGEMLQTAESIRAGVSLELSDDDKVRQSLVSRVERSGTEGAQSFTPPPLPKIIEGLTQGVYRAMGTLAGIELDVFSPLDEGAMTGEQIAESIGVESQALNPLLYVLVEAGLLNVDGVQFTNTPEANTFLVRSSASYLMGLDEMWRILWDGMRQTAESIRTGVAQAKHDYSAASEEESETILRSLHPVTVLSGRELVERYDISAYESLLDVGGITGDPRNGC